MKKIMVKGVSVDWYIQVQADNYDGDESSMIDGNGVFNEEFLETNRDRKGNTYLMVPDEIAQAVAYDLEVNFDAEVQVSDMMTIAEARAAYPAGTRVRLIAMNDPQAPTPGTEGTVRLVDGIGDIHVAWDTGSSLALIPGVDEFERA